MPKPIQAIIATAILSISVATHVNGQESRRTAVVLPPDVVLPVVVSQPECPLKIEDVKLLRYFTPGTYSGGGPGASYRLRNAGRKRIVAYTIATWYSNNSGTIVDWHATEQEQPLLRGRFQKESNDLRIVPLTDDLRAKLDLQPPMLMIRFFMIVELTFSDGTKYDAKKTFAAFQDHLENFKPIYERLKQ